MINKNDIPASVGNSSSMAAFIMDDVMLFAAAADEQAKSRSPKKFAIYELYSAIPV